MMRALALVCVLVPAAAFAAPSQTDQEVRGLSREVAALKLDKTLELTREQARALLPLLEKAQALQAAQKQERNARREKMLPVLRASRDEMRRDGKISEATRKALQEARGEKGTAMGAERKALKTQIGELLTADQRNRLAGEAKAAKLARDEAKGPGKDGKGHGDRRNGGKGKLGGIIASPEFFALVQARAK